MGPAFAGIGEEEGKSVSRSLIPKPSSSDENV